MRRNPGGHSVSSLDSAVDDNAIDMPPDGSLAQMKPGQPTGQPSYMAARGGIRAILCYRSNPKAKTRPQAHSTIRTGMIRCERKKWRTKMAHPQRGHVE